MPDVQNLDYVITVCHSAAEASPGQGNLPQLGNVPLALLRAKEWRREASVKDAAARKRTGAC